MGVTSYEGRARRAWLHKENSTYWVAIGRTTAWSNEASPPTPSPGSCDIEEPIVYVLPDLVSLCRIVSSGEDFTHLGTKYAYVSDSTEATAISEGARFLYIKASFDPTSGQPYGNFRQVAVYSNLDTESVETWVAPASVIDRGTVEYLNNDTVTTMSLSRTETVELIIEFR